MNFVLFYVGPFELLLLVNFYHTLKLFNIQGDPFEDENSVQWRESTKGTSFIYYYVIQGGCLLCRDIAHTWLVIYGKSEYGSKRTTMSKVCAVVCKIWNWWWCHVSIFLRYYKSLLLHRWNWMAWTWLFSGKGEALRYFLEVGVFLRNRLGTSGIAAENITWLSDWLDFVSLICLIWGASEVYFVWSVFPKHGWL